eukprot:TRINITY_DN25341_c0_g1_i1.p1 TRINITY_DN25341_c0_g1~~TRINITY_DN25341_c0_g1_i1.p1  ORF type:complete len:483 (+),score=107.52 TRINITY_DN25341_c0_g1_i1:53-1450(+)
MGAEHRLSTLKSHIPDARAKIEFYFDVSSFNAYRGHKKIPEVARRCNADVIYRPFLIGGLFKALVPDVNYTVDTPKGKFTQYGPVPWMTVLKNKGSKAALFSQKMPAGVMKVREGMSEVRRPLTAGAPSVHAMRTCVAAAPADAANVCAEVMAMYHVKCKMMTPKDMEPVNKKYGIIIGDDVKKALADSTAFGIEQGLVGAPTCMVSHPGITKKALFFGVDRLPLVHQYLKGEDPRSEIEKLFKMRLTTGGATEEGQHVVVYHDIRSPWAYFTVMELERLRGVHKIIIDYRAVDLAQVQEKQGVNPGVSKASIPNKLRYLRDELQLWAKWFGLPPLTQDQVDASPLDTPPQGGAESVLSFLATYPQYTAEVYRAYWVHRKSMATEADVLSALTAQGVKVTTPTTNTLDANLQAGIKTGITTVPLIDLPSTDYALHTDFTNPTGLYLLEDYLCGWRYPEDLELAKI